MDREHSLAVRKDIFTRAMKDEQKGRISWWVEPRAMENDILGAAPRE
jgi:hypothetical protein